MESAMKREKVTWTILRIVSLLGLTVALYAAAVPQTAIAGCGC
jgi:hypothetical protein